MEVLAGSVRGHENLAVDRIGPLLLKQHPCSGAILHGVGEIGVIDDLS